MLKLIHKYSFNIIKIYFAYIKIIFENYTQINKFENDNIYSYRKKNEKNETFY